jgi:redox-sensitive bicupin YhaK (pirin superfamily)
MNDDLVQPNRGANGLSSAPFTSLPPSSRILSGFGEHPHRDAEICTYVVDGFLSHEDSMGTKETLQRGDIQFMVS